MEPGLSADLQRGGPRAGGTPLRDAGGAGSRLSSARDQLGVGGLNQVTLLLGPQIHQLRLRVFSAFSGCLLAVSFVRPLTESQTIAILFLHLSSTHSLSARHGTGSWEIKMTMARITTASRRGSRCLQGTCSMPGRLVQPAGPLSALFARCPLSCVFWFLTSRVASTHSLVQGETRYTRTTP